MQNIVKDKYVIDGQSIYVFTENENENVAMIESSSSVQKFEINQILKVSCRYKINGESDYRALTACVGILNTLTNVLYTETNKIIPTEHKKGEDFTQEEIIEALTKEIDSYVDGYIIESNFNRAAKMSKAKYDLMFRE